MRARDRAPHASAARGSSTRSSTCRSRSRRSSSGSSLFLLYGRDGWFGGWLDDHGIQVLFALPVDGDRDDLRLAAVRRARGRADAARDRRRAGAGGAHARRRRAGRRSGGSRCPSIRWAVIYGVILTTARCLGEYGAVAVVSGRIQGETETATLRVEERYQSLRPRRRLRDLDRARADRRARARRHDRDQTQGGSRLDVHRRQRCLEALRRLRRARRRLARGRRRAR